MGIFPEMFMCGDITVTKFCTDLACICQSNRHHVAPFYIATDNYYTVIHVAGIVVPSATSCKTIHGVKSVRNRDYSQSSAILSTVTHPSHAN